MTYDGFSLFFGRNREFQIDKAGAVFFDLTTHNRTLYHLTENGAETILYFSNKISPAIRQDIDDFLKEKQYDLKEEVSVKADYYLNTNREFEVRCQIVENGFSLIDLKLTVPTEKEAETIVRSWSHKSQEIYTSLLAELL